MRRVPPSAEGLPPQPPVLGQRPAPGGDLRVLGAGVSGLMAAWWHRAAGGRVTVFERAGRAGGLLGTVPTPFGPAERAANGFLWTPALQELADRLGLEVLPPRDAARARWVGRGGRLHRMPLGPLELLGLGRRLLARPAGPWETVADFADDALGAAVHRALLAPGLAGIYGARTAELSFPAVLPELARRLDGRTRLVTALRAAFGRRPGAADRPQGTHGFRGGMEALVAALAESLGGDLRLGTDASACGAPSREAPVLCCLPAPAAGAWLEGVAPGSPLAAELRAVRYAGLVSVTLFLDGPPGPRYRPGFGCLLPEEDGFAVLGVLYNHEIFPDRVRGAARCSLTAILRPEGAGTDAAIVGAVRADLGRLYGGSPPEPLHAVVHRWPAAIPVYGPELARAWPRWQALLERDHPGLALLGNYTGQVSIRGMAEAARAVFGPPA